MILPTRVSGPFLYPGDFGAYLTTTVPLVLSVLFIKFKKRYLRIILGVILIMSTASLVFTGSKSVWLAFVISMFIWAIIGRSKKRVALMLLVILVVVCVFPKHQLYLKSRIVNFFDLSEGGGRDRGMLWQGGWQMFTDSPLLGQGLGTYMHNFQRFRPKGYPSDWLISYPHNCYLQMAAEIGVFGLLVFIWMMGVVLIYAARLLLKQKAETFLSMILLGLSVGLVAYLIHSFFDTNLYSLNLAVLFWVILGLIVSTAKIIEKQCSS